MEWSNEIYDFADSELEKLLKQENKKIELAKFKYKMKIANIVNKQMATSKNVVIEPSDIADVTDKLFDELNTLNKKTFLTIALNADSRAYDECEELLDREEKRRKFKNGTLETILNTFFVGVGFTYYSELKRQKESFNNNIAKVMNEKINRTLQSKSEDEIKEHYPRIMSDAVSLSGVDVLKTFKRLKKSYANYIDNAMSNLVNNTRMRVFKTLGIKYVQRVSQRDKKVCSACEPLDGKVYETEKAPDVSSHYFCRCYYVPYRKNGESDGK